MAANRALVDPEVGTIAAGDGGGGGGAKGGGAKGGGAKGGGAKGGGKERGEDGPAPCSVLHGGEAAEICLSECDAMRWEAGRDATEGGSGCDGRRVGMR
jgi:hypothetical protein